LTEGTRHRDAWIESKQITLPQVFQTTAEFAVQLRKQMFELDQALQRLGRSASFKEFYDGVEKVAGMSRYIAHNAHALKSICDFAPPATTFMDHYINQFSNTSLRRTWWFEGPAFCGFSIEPGSRILEIGCGTGYFTDLFFSPFAREIIAIDIDPRAIETARRMHQAKNIHYELMDLRERLPEGPFDVAIWSPTIVAYTPDEVTTFMRALRGILTANGRLCGWTYVEADRGGPDILWHDMPSLADRLKRYFKNVRVFERVHTTIRPARHALFFSCSDGTLPFDQDWNHGIRLSNGNTRDASPHSRFPERGGE
jgi:SAM-dependent methyltransferase